METFQYFNGGYWASPEDRIVKRSFPMIGLELVCQPSARGLTPADAHKVRLISELH